MPQRSTMKIRYSIKIKRGISIHIVVFVLQPLVCRTAVRYLLTWRKPLGRLIRKSYYPNSTSNCHKLKQLQRNLPVSIGDRQRSSLKNRDVRTRIWILQHLVTSSFNWSRTSPRKVVNSCRTIIIGNNSLLLLLLYPAPGRNAGRNQRRISVVYNCRAAAMNRANTTTMRIRNVNGISLHRPH